LIRFAPVDLSLHGREYRGLRKPWNDVKDDLAYFSAQDDKTRKAIALENQAVRAILRGFRYLEKSQRPDGSWLPLWFGNQYAPDDINPTYGTARVLAAYRDAGEQANPIALRGVEWLEDNQNADGGWGGVKGVPSSVEETALATEILLSFDRGKKHGERGLNWLMDKVESGEYRNPTPIGFYFAKLWYFESLYPLIFTVQALGRASRNLRLNATSLPETPRKTATLSPAFAPEETDKTPAGP
jgi:squalene-hopene/tetraprenyl-beta-curcumene cyclase